MLHPTATSILQCLAPTYLGEYHLKGAELRRSGMNRIGNMVVPNKNYCLFEDWIMPILDAMLKEQKDGTLWTPSKVRSWHPTAFNFPRSWYSYRYARLWTCAIPGCHGGCYL